MFFTWLRARHREKILGQSFPDDSRIILRENVRHYQHLNDQQRARLEGFVRVVVAEKHWAGGSGFELTDAMKVTISGYAGVMTLGLAEPYYFDRLKSIIVYPQVYLPHNSDFDHQAPMIPEGPRLGEAWHRGPVVLSWAEIAGRNCAAPEIIS